MNIQKTLRVTFAALFALVVWTDAIAAQGASMVVDGGIQFGDGTIQYSALVGYAPVGDSGQNRCYDELGTEIGCGGSGQDGERQAGSDWPAPRFVHNQDGTVSDVLTGLVWLADADCFGELDWNAALTAVAGLMAGICDLDDESVATDWRLPNIKELMSLLDYGESMPALVPGHPFADVRMAAYWTSTTAMGDPSTAWAVGLDTGYSDAGPKSSLALNVWPVRGGQ